MKLRKFALTLFIVLCSLFICMACSKSGGGSGGGGKLSGTYVNEAMQTSYTFSGNKVTLEMMGEKMEFTYETKDGKLIANSADFGKTEDAYTLKGNTLTIRGADYTKK
jgi:major membrane immunogen (membrane-anchored lipoprotein)